MQGPEDAKPLFDAGDWIALGAAVVALVAMSIAIWQAYEARQSRKATEEQADNSTKALKESKKQSAAAEKSATSAMLALGSAERAAGAAEDQVVLARHAFQAAKDQVEIAQRAAEAAERSAQADESSTALAKKQAHDAAAPKFEFATYRGSAPRTQIEVTMLEGHALATVTITPTGNNAGVVRHFEIEGSNEEPSSVLRFGATRKGEFYKVVVHSEELTGPTVVALDVHCVPVDPATEPWTVHETLTLHRPSRVTVLG